MGIIEISLIGLGLTMDAATVCMSNAMSNNINRNKMLLSAFLFGLFQAIMPLIGYFAGSTFSESIKAFDHWIAFILLSIIGVKMIIDAKQNDDDTINHLTLKLLLSQAVATSIDALAVGVSLSAILNESNGNIFVSITIIGVITFICSLISSIIGKRIGNALNQKAQVFGGFILILIGLKILIEHLLIG